MGFTSWDVYWGDYIIPAIPFKGFYAVPDQISAEQMIASRQTVGSIMQVTVDFSDVDQVAVCFWSEDKYEMCRVADYLAVRKHQLGKEVLHTIY